MSSRHVAEAAPTDITKIDLVIEEGIVKSDGKSDGTGILAAKNAHHAMTDMAIDMDAVAQLSGKTDKTGTIGSKRERMQLLTNQFHHHAAEETETGSLRETHQQQVTGTSSVALELRYLKMPSWITKSDRLKMS